MRENWVYFYLKGINYTHFSNTYIIEFDKMRIPFMYVLNPFHIRFVERQSESVFWCVDFGWRTFFYLNEIQ